MTDEQDVTLARLDERQKALDEATGKALEAFARRADKLENRQWWFVGGILVLLADMVIGLSNIGASM